MLDSLQYVEPCLLTTTNNVGQIFFVHFTFVVLFLQLKEFCTSTNCFGVMASMHKSNFEFQATLLLLVKMGRTAVNRWILWQVVFALCARCAALGAYCTVYVIVVILLPGLHFPTTHSGRVGRRCATPCLPSAQYWSLFLFSLSWLPGPQQISHSPKGARKRIITITYVLRTVK